MTTAIRSLLLFTVVCTAQENSVQSPSSAWAGIDAGNSAGHMQGVAPLGRPSAPREFPENNDSIAIGGGTIGSSLVFTCDPSVSAISGVCTTLNTTIAALYTSKFSDVNVNIYVTFGSTGLGQSQYIVNPKTYAAFRSALQLDQTDANDNSAFVNSVPPTNPINVAYSLYLTNANARALGFSANSGLQLNGSTSCTIGSAGCYDGIITISSAQQSAGHLYFRSGPSITGAQYDFYTVVEHEADEILGTPSCSISGCSSHFYPADLYRYQSNGTRSFAAGNNNSCASSNSGNACFSLNGVTMLQQYNNLGNGADSGDWVTDCAHPLVQDAFGCPGVSGLDISPTAELLVLDVIGYSVVAAPPLLVPNVVGMTKATAATAITSLGLVVGTITTVSSNTIAAGSVVSENPVAGTQVNIGSAVNLVISGSQPLSATPLSGSAGRQLFTFVMRDASGANSIQYAQFIFSKAGISALNSCYISYDPGANAFYLLSDDSTQWYGLLGGSGNTIGNAQCTIYGSTSGSSKIGTDLTTHVDISFRSGFAGFKAGYAFSGDTLGNGSGWQPMVSWNDTGDPSVVELVSLTPNSGSGLSQIFTAAAKDGNGATTIPSVQLVMNNSLNGVNGCFIHYDRASNAFFLLNDAATTFSGLPGGSAAQVSNSQCTLHGVGSGGTAVGPDLTITYNLTFSAGFVGAKQIYMEAADNAGVIEVWHQMGTWIQ